MALDTVSDYVSDARTLMQDVIIPPRYDDNSLIVAFNVALMEARRLRADLFIGQYGTLAPVYTTDDLNAQPSTQVPFEQPFRLALLYGIVGHALARDQEDIQDGRASAFLTLFNETLTGVKAPPIGGGGGAPPRGR